MQDLKQKLHEVTNVKKVLKDDIKTLEERFLVVKSTNVNLEKDKNDYKTKSEQLSEK